MKLWDKGTSVNKLIETFTVGKDRELDMFLAEFDVLGTIAHIKMLESINLITKKELPLLIKELIHIYNKIKAKNFNIEEGVEDIHSQIEIVLTRQLGNIGKKVHSGRSRNDQVLVDLKLFIRNELKDIAEHTQHLFNLLITKSEENKNILMPGYTHLQIAMPSSFGLWFGAFAESLTDDMQMLITAYKINNQNPLGSAAGYGSSFPLNRTMTTHLLGFDNLNYNVIYAQMGRGKVEKTISFAISSLAGTLNKLAADFCLFISQNFNFIQLPDQFTTGSSIMPHKKNPDVFELLRSHLNRLQSLPNTITMMTTNLTSGYFRDLQLIKEVFIPAFEEIKTCLHLMSFAIKAVEVNENIMDDEKYKYIYSVEDVNKEVLKGTPFRDAYQKIGKLIQDNEYIPQKTIHHTHEGSIGNLCNSEIKNKMNTLFSQFNFKKVEEAINKLLKQNE